MMRSGILLLLLVCIPVAWGAEDIRPWDDSWSIGVFVNSCTLTRKFSNEKAQEAVQILGWEIQEFDRFSISLTIPNNTREYGGTTFVANELNVSIRTDKYPAVSDAQLGVDSIRIGEIVLRKHLYSEAAHFRYFIAQGEDATTILRRLENVEPVVLTLGLTNGTSESISVPSSTSEQFVVWAKLLHTCAAAKSNRLE